jgi:hypothetical protein
MGLLLSYTEVSIQTKQTNLLVKYIKEGKEPITVELFIGLAKLEEQSEKQRLEETNKAKEDALEKK